MEKREVAIDDLKLFLLSPGNIFWKKISGEEVLISKKGDLCNLNLIKKIQSSNQKILIENEVDRVLLKQLAELFKSFEEELLMPKKIVEKNKIIEVVKSSFVESPKTQFELNLVFWNIFSKISFADGEDFANQDRDCFTRSMTIASLTTFFAILLGYYEMNFLRGLYSKIIIDYKTLLQNKTGMTVKNILEKFRNNDLNELDLASYFNISKDNLFFEKTDGTGVLEYKTSELSDIENIYVQINNGICHVKDVEENILFKMKNENNFLDQKYSNVFKKYFGENLKVA